jgi:hypothetical protein
MTLKTYYKMVRTQQRARTDLSLVQRRGYNSLYGSEIKGDPLTDIASHLPATSAHFEKSESVEHQDDSTSHLAEVSLPRATDGQGQDDKPSLMALTVALNSYLDPAFIEQMIKEMVVGMTAEASNTTLRSERVITIIQ